MKSKVIIIVGPTASGKSDFAVELALKINGEIISADSRQVYNGLDMGSGKITEPEMKGVMHYGLGVAEPMSHFTAANWLSYTEDKMEEIITKNKTPIIVGGTGLYIDALIYGIEDKRAPDYELREILKKLSKEELQNIIINKCNDINSGYYDNLNNSEKNNKERLIRKIETLDFEIEKHAKKQTLEVKGPAFKSINTREIRKDYEFEFIIIERSKEELKRRIDLRLERRLEVNKDGVNPLINEVKNIIEKQNNSDEIKSWLIKLGLEYKYVTLYHENKLTYEEMKKNIINESFKYAKRQITWNKKYPPTLKATKDTVKN